MKRLVRLLSIGAVFALLGSALLPAFAQDSNPAAGEGGTIVVSNIADDPSTFIPFIGSDTVSSSVYTILYPAIITYDPKTLIEAPGVPDGMAESWEYDETGTILTIKLRQDLKWNDGSPVTAKDYMWAYNAVKSGKTSSPRTSALYQLDDGTVTEGHIFSVEMVDDYTVIVTLGSPELDAEGVWTGKILPNCTAISDINDITPVPAAVWDEHFGTDVASVDTDPYFVGPTFGAFKDPYMEFGVQVSLIDDQTYPDTAIGYVSPGEWILRQVDNTDVEYARFLAGDFTYINVTPNKQNELRDLAATDGYQLIEYPQGGYTYMSYNLADPNNPQPGKDEAGNYIDQGQHPIFGDVKVRQALAHAVNIVEMIGTRPSEGKEATGILQGNGTPLATHNHPGLSWIDPELELYSFDPDLAKEMLKEAGWEDQDGDGIIECHGCKYATEVDPSFEGKPFEFELLTNAGNRIRESAGETIKTQLASIGVQVNFQAIEFGTLVTEARSQTFDAIIIGWSLGLPFNPDGSPFFGAGADIPTSGFNFPSYQNPKIEDLWRDAGSLPGCAQEDRIPLYREAMKMLYDDQPYMWLFAGNVMYAAQPNVKNWDPLPYAFDWNQDAWAISDQ